MISNTISLHLALSYLLLALQELYPEYQTRDRRSALPRKGSRSQAFLFDMLKRLFPDSPIDSNVIMPTENIILEESDRLRVYEFDVSCTSSLLKLYWRFYRTTVAA